MLILHKSKNNLAKNTPLSPYLLAFLALGISLPFGFFSATIFESSLAGTILGSSLFAYTILIIQLFQKQPPIFIKRYICKEYSEHKSIAEISGLKIDFVGNRDPQNNNDGLIHTKSGELQRIVSCKIPSKISEKNYSIWLERLFSKLSSFKGIRFQLIFLETSKTCSRNEFLLIASFSLSEISILHKRTGRAPLALVSDKLSKILEMLLILGSEPKLLGAQAVRSLISEELGAQNTKRELEKDWRNLGNLGWEPCFRDIEMKASNKFMQVGKRHFSSLCINEIPSESDFNWLVTLLKDMSDKQIVIFIDSKNSSDLRISEKLKYKYLFWSKLFKIQKENIQKNIFKKEKIEKIQKKPKNKSQISFFIRIESNSPANLSQEHDSTSMYLASLGIKLKENKSKKAFLQLHNWQSTLPLAQNKSSSKLLFLFE